MPARYVLACVLGVLASCSAPDYTAVREWARTASIAADQVPPPRPETRAVQGPAGIGGDASGEVVRAGASPMPATVAGTLAMQSALAVYLSSIATLASDGVLPYLEDPFVELASQAAAVDADGGAAVGALGTFLRHASRTNMRAPEIRHAVVSADPAVQALVSALSAALARACVSDADGRHAAGAALVTLERAPGGVAQLAEQEIEASPRRDPAGCSAAQDRHVETLKGIAEAHAFLKANAARITQAETQRQIRAAEDRMRRAMLRLPRRRVARRFRVQPVAYRRCPRRQRQQ